MNDVLAVQVQLSDAKLRHVDQENNVRLARLSVNNLLGLPLDTDVRLATTVSHQLLERKELDALQQLVLSQRRELQSMVFKVKAGEAAVTVARSGWFPRIVLTGNYDAFRPNQRYFPLRDSFKDTWDVGVSVSLDLWTWGATVHQIEQAESQPPQAEDKFAQLKDASV